jgi:peptidoglycan/xylan/chitin deacetylase (PgdA/CDA1 family)
VFIVSDALGQSPPWLAGNGNGYSTQDEIMTAEQLQKLPSDLVAIGSHTMTHPCLPVLSEDDAKRELAGSRKNLEEILRREVRLFSFPHGAFNGQLINWCREAGYERVFTISPTMAFSDPREYVTGRVLADATDWNLEFCLKVLGAYRWLPHAFRWKGRILNSLKRVPQNPQT